MAKSPSPLLGGGDGPAAERRARLDGAERCRCLPVHLLSLHQLLRGLRSCYFGRKYGFVIDRDGATSISAGIDGGQPWRRTFGDNVTYTDWRKDNYFHAVQTLTKGVKRLGVEFDHITLDTQRQLQDALPGVELVDVGQPSMWMRTIKSAEEHVLIRKGAQVADIGGAAVAEAVAAGVPEHEVAIAGTNAMIREIAASYPYVELMDTWTWFQSGINTDGAHNPVTNRVVQAGDILSLNTFPMIFGYYTALERTLFCEHASDAHLDLWEKNVAVHRRGLDLINLARGAAISRPN